LEADNLFISAPTDVVLIR